MLLMLVVGSVAVMVAVPGDMPVASPEEVMVATAGSELAQVTVAVRSWVEPSLKVPVAVNCRGPATRRVTWGGVTARLTRTGTGVTVLEGADGLLVPVALVAVTAKV